MTEDEEASDLIAYVLAHGGDIYITEEVAKTGENLIHAELPSASLLEPIRPRLNPLRNAIKRILIHNGRAEIQARKIAKTWLETIARRTKRKAGK